MPGLTSREAVAGDHAALEKLFRETLMAGAIRIGSDRSPDFFVASRVQAEEPRVCGEFSPARAERSGSSPWAGGWSG